MLGAAKKKRDGLAIIIAQGLAKEHGEHADETSVEKQSAAEEVLSAIEAKDPNALAEALEAMIELCMNSDQAEEVS